MNISAVRKPVMRPRSPEAQPAGRRARSPIVKQGAGSLRQAPAFLSSGTSAPQQSSGGRSPQHSQQHQHQFGAIPKRASGSTTVEEIKKIDLNREQRRRAAEEVRRSRQEEQELLGGAGRAPDIDFHRMIRDFRQQLSVPTRPEPIDLNAADAITVCVRKRPLATHEVAARELDCVTALNPLAIIHERKFKVDGITKCLESHSFEFDRVFSEEDSQELVYSTITAPLVPWVIDSGGRATLFAYGQTGSGKTHTMTGIQRQMAEHIFEDIGRYGNSQQGRSDPLSVSVSFFEIYGGRPFDLLNNRTRLETLEDSKNEVQIAGLVERAITSPVEMLQLIDLGNSLRTTHATAINRDSSRSHAVCNIFLRRHSSPGEVHGKWALVDLAGSERAADSKSSIRQRRVEGAQINKSLLALKECIRAMGNGAGAHIPFRASKLTLVLRDAFITRGPSKTLMIACISPGMASADHSVNTLRYSDRLKDHPRASRAYTDLRDDDGTRIRTGSSVATGAARGPSPDGRRLRSPSPSGGQIDPGRARGPSGHSAGEVHPKDVLEGDYIDDEEETDDEYVPEEPVRLPPQVQTAWPEAQAETAPADPSRAVAGGGSRQPVSRAAARGDGVDRRGRQPALRPREPVAPSRPEALDRRGDAAVLGSRGTAAAVPLLSQVAAPSEAAANNGGRDRSPATNAERGAPRSPRNHRERSPKRVEPTGDLLQQDNRYLHNTLTSELVAHAERGGRSPAAVDVGIEDLTDLAHMEALDEVRQWEDRIVSQHMVALQEDARLLTVESELLSQVQQGASYDIDWYVSEVDKVVRRKMEVYAGFLDELEVFKAQLRREESLSQSCQRQRPARSGTGSSGAGGSANEVARDLGLGDSTPQRTPRTPRTGAG